MKKHKTVKHGINVVWFPCSEDNCDYRAKLKGSLKRHKQNVHKIGVVWHQYDLCEFKTKTGPYQIKAHQKNTNKMNRI
ncbi:hypothetical protein TL16_g10306 [Triparma laevis f. inornata]|uniref:C2H2-type domain-containing protein n=1 Tax=Triparma laevis f. inornata TaxID=1714386 RepID=A0A9W7BGD9_9STRA|nr:hypothetical protein TL16_g10306 [Triparma laevis f. inornata]